MNLDIRVRPLAGSPLVQRYLAGDPEVQSFFTGDPFSLRSFQKRWEHLQHNFSREKRIAAAEALRPTSAAARDKLSKFVQDGGAVVTTGQQAGLFTGPLYTISKALTAIRLAEELETSLGMVVLPVFWTASEDHDWTEVNHTYVVDRGDNLRRIHVSSGEERPLPMAERLLESSIESAINELAQVIAGEEYRKYVLEWIEDGYREGNTVADAFSKVIASLFSEFDLSLTDATDSALKRTALPVLRRALGFRAEHEAILRDTAERLQQLGFAPQVPVLPEASNIFIRTEHGRERLFSDSAGWTTRESRRRFKETDLDALLASEPVRFSPNVLLRPVVENSVFPVLAYVAGPGEIAYFAQLGPLFEHHGLQMPLVYPRASVLLAEDRVQRYLAHTRISISSLRAPRHELIRQRSRASLPAHVKAALRDLRTDMTNGFDRLGAMVGDLDSTLINAVGARRNRALLTVAEAEEKILRSVARGENEWIKQMDAVRNHLVPCGGDQERLLNIMPFLARHSPSLLSAMASQIPIRWNDVPTDAAPARNVPEWTEGRSRNER